MLQGGNHIYIFDFKCDRLFGKKSEDRAVYVGKAHGKIFATMWAYCSAENDEANEESGEVINLNDVNSFLPVV